MHPSMILPRPAIRTSASECPLFPKGFGVDRLTMSPYDVLHPHEAPDFPATPVENFLPPIAKPSPLLDETSVQAALCKAFHTPQERVDVGCKWYRNEANSVPVCVSSHTPTSLMGTLEQCNPDLFKNIEARVKESLHGTANDCTWVVVNDEHFARLFCDPTAMPYVIDPKAPPAINPDACAELQKVIVIVMCVCV
jgi:hypothetical protein